jgi:hypothetical protein
MDGNERQGQAGGGGQASATVRFLRRTFVEVETDGTCPGTPCADTTYEPGQLQVLLSAMEWNPWKRLTFVPLPLDINADDVVNDADVAAVLAAWGDLKQDNFADTNLDGRVDAVDLVRVLSGWGGDGRE